jgi:hypothetical protein
METSIVTTWNSQTGNRHGDFWERLSTDVVAYVLAVLLVIVVTYVMYGSDSLFNGQRQQIGVRFSVTFAAAIVVMFFISY